MTLGWAVTVSTRGVERWRAAFASMSTCAAFRGLYMRMDDEGAGFDALFRAEYPRVVSAVRWIVGNTAVAEEITQDAFCRALERWNRVRNHERPGAWVQLTALRLAVRANRRGRRAARLEVASESLGLPTARDVDLERAIDQLSDGQRNAVVLHYLLDLPVADVAEVLGVRPGTVKAQLHRARGRLASLLSEEEVTDVDR